MCGRTVVSKLLAIGIVAAGAGCSSGGPRNPTSPIPAGIEIIAGAGQRDTIQSTPVQALVVKVNPPSGSTAAGQVVQFQTIPATRGTGDVFVKLLTSNLPSTSVFQYADSSTGEASVQIVMDTIAGPAKVVVTVPGFGLVDTVGYTVLPGNTALYFVGPADTAIYLTGADTVLEITTDRFHNITALKPPQSVSVVSGPATASGNVVTGNAYGVATIAVSIGGPAVDLTATIVPTGTLGASLDAGGVVMFNLDGSGVRELTNLPGQMVKWGPSGASLVFNNTGEALAFGSPMYTVDTARNVVIVDSPAGSSGDGFPSFSRDGQWIYYSRYLDGVGVLWRIHPDGTGSTQVPNLNPGSDYWPSTSPDGSTLVYTDLLSGHLRSLVIATGVVTDLGVAGHSDQYAPDSSSMLYISGDNLTGSLTVSHADGTSPRTLGGASYNWGIDWSPDGQWVVARNAGTGLIEVINQNTGLVLPLGYTGGIGSPTWRPGSGVSHALRGSSAVVRLGNASSLKRVR